jgi:hypothetical protein
LVNVNAARIALHLGLGKQLAGRVHVRGHTDDGGAQLRRTRSRVRIRSPQFLDRHGRGQRNQTRRIQENRLRPDGAVRYAAGVQGAHLSQHPAKNREGYFGG